jgi:hypothetical protein
VTRSVSHLAVTCAMLIVQAAIRCVLVKVPSRDTLNTIEAVCMEPVLAIACSVDEVNSQPTKRLLPPSMLHRST